MAKETSKREAKAGPVGKMFEVKMPKLPADFQGAQYGNRIAVSASAQEVFLDLLQLGPEVSGSGESRAIFVGRFIFPLILAKVLISDLQRFVEQIEKDTGIKLPEPEEVRE